MRHLTAKRLTTHEKNEKKNRVSLFRRVLAHDGVKRDEHGLMKKTNSVRTIILAGSLLLQLSTLCIQSRGEAGDVDLSFDPGFGVNGPVNAVAVQPDGKVIIGGKFTAFNGIVRPYDED